MQPGSGDELVPGGIFGGACYVCAGLIRLCGHMDFFSPDTEVRRMLIDKLHSIADDHTHAKAIIDRWQAISPAAPKVSDFHRMAEMTRVLRLPDGCPSCHGEPFVSGPDGRWGRCTCLRGQALAKSWRAA